MAEKWEIWIDTGGTFTDGLARSPEGELRRVKVLSSGRLRGRLLRRVGPGRFSIAHRWPVSTDIFRGYRLQCAAMPGAEYRVVRFEPNGGLIEVEGDFLLPERCDFELSAREEAPVLAARLLLQTPLDQPFPPLAMRLGTTRGTNALLERKGASVALLTTSGFADLAYIGAQQRPALFQLAIPEPPVLYRQVLEVDERLDADGQVLQPLTGEEIARLITALRRLAVEAVAVALLHAYRNPVHEIQLGQALREAGFRFVSLSAVLTPSIKLLPRLQAALVNAYLSPVLHDYLTRIRQKLDGASLLAMTSMGGLNSAGAFPPKDSLLSGPAGGVVGAAQVAARFGFDRVLTIDMGGTSTDTARYDGGYDVEYTTRVGGIEMASPTLAIETVAAGGGSICGFDGARLTVGPDSAGAFPGPACYGKGGPLTLTDVNLLLGKLDPAAIGIPIDADAAFRALQTLRTEIETAAGEPYSESELLRGFEAIADEKMAEAIRRISVAKGFDPQEYVLLPFGGAGGLHACRIAELLDIDRIVLPYDAGLLSAFGIGQASVERLAKRQILKSLAECAQYLTEWFSELEQEARALLEKDGYPAEATEIGRRQLFLRFRGQESTLEIPYRPGESPDEAFADRYRRLFGHYPTGQTIELESLEVLAITRRERVREVTVMTGRTRPSPAKFTTGEGQSTAVYHWDELQPGDYFTGPAILLNPFATAYLATGWETVIQPDGACLADCREGEQRRVNSKREAIALELFTNRFRSIADEMGARLQRTAFSVNIKERLDFSCAVLDAGAELLVNAPHIPVHLGSLGVCARLVLERLTIGPGDVVITNHPRYGGSHLPDVTLLCGVFTPAGEKIGYVINRAHHAEIGGSRPGSMPPGARRLVEEGVVIAPTYLMRNGRMRWAAVEEILTTGPWPSRAPAENLADINAALASLRAGAAALEQLTAAHGLAKVHRYMARLKEQADEQLSALLANWRGKTLKAAEALDDGRRICVRIEVSRESLVIDFAGTSSVHPGNLNANVSIVYSAVIYVLRVLCGGAIPLNEGLMRRVQVHLPTSFLNPAFSEDPAACPAVVGGNTEVSQRLVDTLLKAFGVAACSQGTMNNFLFGNDRFGYYETIGGGAGAGPGFHGRSAVHQHMTNTRITDPEELEHRYPVRLQRFAIRRGSGGAGRWRGGDGIIREFVFLEPVAVTLLSQHRREAPYGMEGGKAGAPGEQRMVRKNGKEEALKGIDSREAAAGDRIAIFTPGGGGWGAPDS